MSAWLELVIILATLIRVSTLAIAFEPARVSAATAAADVGCVTSALQADGVARVDGVLTPAVAASLLEHIDDRLDAAMQEARNEVKSSSATASPHELLSLTDAALAKRFGDVLCGTRRHDLKLDLREPAVEAAVACVLSALRPTFAECLGADAELYELAALISDMGAVAQPLHPDTPFVEGEGPVVLTAFIAVQDVDADMGPTIFLPATHTAEAHAAFASEGESGGREMAGLLGSRPSWRGAVGAGDATIYDSRLLHCGGANEASRRRLFYVSFRASGVEASFRATQGTLLEGLRGRRSLRTL